MYGVAWALRGLFATRLLTPLSMQTIGGGHAPLKVCIGSRFLELDTALCPIRPTVLVSPELLVAPQPLLSQEKETERERKDPLRRPDPAWKYLDLNESRHGSSHDLKVQDRQLEPHYQPLQPLQPRFRLARWQCCIFKSKLKPQERRVTDSRLPKFRLGPFCFLLLHEFCGTERPPSRRLKVTVQFIRDPP
ncbi:uncharacterized protein PAC_00404 [Phialocephala subalpina]|uniref:Uncharacterized protein n=1 Tax=Phialocephala subalpina TaxID=576137 RepID=A0A1L7WCP5_9HELO|nr:uncharacterized protein PAC_00404 [Phialocephala subalpina]